MVNIKNFPIQATILMTNTIFSAVLAFVLFMIEAFSEISILMVVMLIPAVVAVVTMYCQYSFDIAHAAAMGREETPVFEFKGLQFQALIISIVSLSVSYLVIGELGTHLGSIILGITLPTLMCSLIAERSFVKAINPLNWLSYIAQLKQYYALPVVSVIFIYQLSALLSSDYWLWPKLFVFMGIILWNFYFVGHVLFTHRKALRMNTPETRQEREERLQKESHDKTFEHHTDYWHKLATVREFTKACGLINDYIHSQNDQVLTAEKVMVELCAWANTRLAAKFLPDYLDYVLAERKFGLAHAKLKLLLPQHEDIRVTAFPYRTQLYEFAREIHDHDVADRFIQTP